jgi:UDP-glucose 4-epimerase
MEVLITGGLGYIGSHTVIRLILSGKKVVIVDNLSNSTITTLYKLEMICKCSIPCYISDICNLAKMEKIFAYHMIGYVIHFAGFKSITESIDYPLEYYQNNINSLIILLEVMASYGVKKIVFSSSATVYKKSSSKLLETDELSCTNPYGFTKLFCEQILKDWFNSNKERCVIILRYFNPIGAHYSGLIGENPIGIPNNLMPYILRVIRGELNYLSIFGNDYNTHDGTGERDYIHVIDLSDAHIAACENFTEDVKIYNIGSGRCYTVLDILKTVENIIGKPVPYKIENRRLGDIDSSCSDCTKANIELKWTAKLNLYAMCEDSMRYYI